LANIYIKIKRKIIVNKLIKKIMGRFISNFQTTAELLSFSGTTGFSTPHVSMTKDTSEIHYFEKIESQYRWVDDGYTCVGYDKYTQQKQQVSNDSGETWTDTGVVSAVTLVEANSEDCGYIGQIKLTCNYIPGQGGGSGSGSGSGGGDTKLYEKASYFIDFVTSVKIDGVEVEKETVTSWYTFADENEHEVEYTLESTSEIPYRAFDTCSTLINATIGNGITSIGTNAFYYCTSLTSVTILDSVTSIGNSAFGSCSGLTRLNSDTDGVFNIPSGVTSIGGEAFRNCSCLTSIDIPSGVTSIGGWAFDETPWWNTYSADTSHRYGNIIYINDIAYKTTSSGITSCTFREGTVSIGGSAFMDCSSLTSVTIPDSVTSIGRSAFMFCTSLTSVTIPDSVTSIGGEAFYNCTGLTSIVIPNSVTTIGDFAFSGCESLPIENNIRYADIYAVKAVDKNLTTYSLKSNTKWIGESAFYGCSGLTSITIPDSVTSIGYNAFQYCSGLTSVTIPDSVTSIGQSAFQNCSGLTSITIGSGVTSIGTYAFYDCTSLTSVTVNATTPPTLGDGVFATSNDCPIYVPSGSVDAYKAASVWSDYESRIQAIP
jgi:hypothetical protein